MKQIKAEQALQSFGETYLKCSGLPIPEEYLHEAGNRIFGIYWKKQMIGGFILGCGSEFRTVKLFAKEKKHEGIYEKMGDSSKYTEICCFWIKRAFRTNTFLNFFIWFAMTYALKRYGTSQFLFGTCSRSLARLYGQTSKSILINRDFINGKATFIFLAERSSCVTGMLEIIRHKFKRKLKLQISRRKYIPAHG